MKLRRVRPERGSGLRPAALPSPSGPGAWTGARPTIWTFTTGTTWAQAPPYGQLTALAPAGHTVTPIGTAAAPQPVVLNLPARMSGR